MKTTNLDAFSLFSCLWHNEISCYFHSWFFMYIVHAIVSVLTSQGRYNTKNIGKNWFCEYVYSLWIKICYKKKTKQPLNVSALNITLCCSLPVLTTYMYILDNIHGHTYMYCTVCTLHTFWHCVYWHGCMYYRDTHKHWLKAVFTQI